MDRPLPETKRFLESVMGLHDPDAKCEKLSSEVIRLSTELDQVRRQLVTVSEHKDELEGYLRINPDTLLPVYRIFLKDLSDHIQTGAPFWLAQIRLDTSYQRIKSNSNSDTYKALLYITTQRIMQVAGQSLYQSDRMDEFFLLGFGDGDNDEVVKTLVNVEKQIELPHEWGARNVSFGANIGYSLYPTHGEDAGQIISNAEIGLRRAITARKKIAGYHIELGKAFAKQVQLEHDLHNAIQSGFENFFLVYQPFVDDKHQIRGCESLIRWSHPSFGFVPPPQFIPLAERSGDIRMFGRWILYKSLLALKSWHQAGFKDVFVSVNLSPVQFNQKDMVSKLQEVLDSSETPPEFLKLEVTEGAIMADPSDAIAKLQALRKLGIRISIDDFGTGYSSLNYLRKLPIDTLKIDKSFIDEIVGSQRNLEIVRAILAMANSLGIETLAEGVETLEQKDLLFSEGCKYIQGYYFSKPVTDDIFHNYLLGGGSLPIKGSF